MKAVFKLVAACLIIFLSVSHSDSDFFQGPSGDGGLALEDEADRVVIKKIGAHAVGHADEHVARVRVDLADGGQDLQGAVRV